MAAQEPVEARDDVRVRREGVQVLGVPGGEPGLRRGSSGEKEGEDGGENGRGVSHPMRLPPLLALAVIAGVGYWAWTASLTTFVWAVLVIAIGMAAIELFLALTAGGRGAGFVSTMRVSADSLRTRDDGLTRGLDRLGREVAVEVGLVARARGRARPSAVRSPRLKVSTSPTVHTFSYSAARTARKTTLARRPPVESRNRQHPGFGTSMIEAYEGAPRCPWYEIAANSCLNLPGPSRRRPCTTSCHPPRPFADGARKAQRIFVE